MNTSGKLAWIEQEHLLSALTRLRIGYWMLDLSDQKLKCTPQCKENFGFDQDLEITYFDLLDHILLEDRPNMEKAVFKALNNTNEEYFARFHTIQLDGTLKFIEARGAVIIKDGMYTAMTGTTQDITESNGERG